MASTPEAHPDSPPPAHSTDVEQVSDPSAGQHTDVEGGRTDSGPERGVPDSPGVDGGTAGTGGTNHAQDHDVTS